MVTASLYTLCFKTALQKHVLTSIFFPSYYVISQLTKYQSGCFICNVAFICHILTCIIVSQMFLLQFLFVCSLFIFLAIDDQKKKEKRKEKKRHKPKILKESKCHAFISALRHIPQTVKIHVITIFYSLRRPDVGPSLHGINTR